MRETPQQEQVSWKFPSEEFNVLILMAFLIVQGLRNFFPTLFILIIYMVILTHHQLLLWQIESDSLLMLLPLCKDIIGLAS